MGVPPGGGRAVGIPKWGETNGARALAASAAVFAPSSPEDETTVVVDR